MVKILFDGTEVSDDTPTKATARGHELLTEEEQAEKSAREAAWEAEAKDRHNRQAQAKRAAAYGAESDYLFFKYQRGELEKQVWLDKVEEIKQRYPYMEE